jgi:hypothetical protein
MADGTVETRSYDLVNLELSYCQSIFSFVMNALENIIRETIVFIVNKYIEPFKKNCVNPDEFKRKVSQSKEFIITVISAAEPFHIADEVLFFYLAINDEIANHSEYLLSKSEPLRFAFPIFPFPLVNSLAPLALQHQIELWKHLESYITLFEGANYFLRTPRLPNKQATAPIYCAVKDIHDFEEDEGILCYSSLTNLLLMVAECYETGAYYFHKPSTYGSWREDFSKSEPIFHKYHPGLPFRSPHESSHFLDDC